jgi:hypothetical protein
MFPGHETESNAGGGGDAGAARLTCTATVTLSTVNEATYDPAGSEEATVTVRFPLFVPLRGDTWSHDAVGAPTVHFKAPLPVLRMATDCEGIAVPAVP